MREVRKKKTRKSYFTCYQKTVNSFSSKMNLKNIFLKNIVIILPVRSIKLLIYKLGDVVLRTKLVD